MFWLRERQRYREKERKLLNWVKAKRSKKNKRSSDVVFSFIIYVVYVGFNKKKKKKKFVVDVF